MFVSKVNGRVDHVMSTLMNRSSNTITWCKHWKVVVGHLFTLAMRRVSELFLLLKGRAVLVNLIEPIRLKGHI
jgi:hypothetical protein